nr:serine/arginine repetitive matrix protein 1-like [Aegilops tauschii subsp. strangulata]
MEIGLVASHVRGGAGRRAVLVRPPLGTGGPSSHARGMAAGEDGAGGTPDGEAAAGGARGRSARVPGAASGWSAGLGAREPRREPDRLADRVGRPTGVRRGEAQYRGHSGPARGNLPRERPTQSLTAQPAGQGDGRERLPPPAAGQIRPRRTCPPATSLQPIAGYHVAFPAASANRRAPPHPASLSSSPPPARAARSRPVGPVRRLPERSRAARLSRPRRDPRAPPPQLLSPPSRRRVSPSPRRPGRAVPVPHRWIPPAVATGRRAAASRGRPSSVPAGPRRRR